MPSKPPAPGSDGNRQGQTGGGGGGRKTPLLAARRGLRVSARSGRGGQRSPSRGKPSRSAMVLLYSVGVRARGGVRGGRIVRPLLSEAGRAEEHGKRERGGGLHRGDSPDIGCASRIPSGFYRPAGAEGVRITWIASSHAVGTRPAAPLSPTTMLRRSSKQTATPSCRCTVAKETAIESSRLSTRARTSRISARTSWIPVLRTLRETSLPSAGLLVILEV